MVITFLISQTVRLVEPTARKGRVEVETRFPREAVRLQADDAARWRVCQADAPGVAVGIEVVAEEHGAAVGGGHDALDGDEDHIVLHGGAQWSHPAVRASGEVRRPRSVTRPRSLQVTSS